MPQSFSDRDGLIWIDGEIVPWREAKVHVLSHGLHYASSVFEGERAYSGKIFKSELHSKRLRRSAELIDMDMPLSAEDIESAKHEILAANKLQDAYIRAFAWRGSEQMGIAARGAQTHTAIACWEWPSYFEGKRETGISVQIGKWRAPHPDTAPTSSKTACLYSTHTMSKHAAEDAGYDDALMLDYRGYLAEATGANLFLVKDGGLVTPDPDCFLNGLTRQTVIELAHEAGIAVDIRHVKPEELDEATEIFLTGTAAEVTPVGKIDNRTYPVGPVTRKLRTMYEELVRT